jgi:hypothetical protein
MRGRKALLHVLWLLLLALPASARAQAGQDCLQWLENEPKGSGFSCILTRQQARDEGSAPMGRYMAWDKAGWLAAKGICAPNRHPYYAAACNEADGVRRQCAARTPFDFSAEGRRICHMTGEWNSRASRTMELAAYLVDHQESTLACANIIKFERINIFESLDRSAAKLDLNSAKKLRKRLAEIEQQRHAANVGVIKESLKSLEPAGADLLASYRESGQSWTERLKEFVENISMAGQGKYLNCLSKEGPDKSLCDYLQTSQKISRIQGDVAILQGAADAVLGNFMQCSALTSDVVKFLQADAAFQGDKAEKPVIFEGAVDKAKERIKNANKR